eukprot:gnl/Hemi2/15285_TR5150_c0_g1_i1.p1 gnl/Hemi2/15285_TR5150_c0_g1~~gnl/Hemi2/15285_TR5150_c0_g1_i1.p1  ORF type:complete len:371 (-),score=142.88 gnl/Hemi2/15285_TR5150_c0_g1_i1:67-1116(-)
MIRDAEFWKQEHGAPLLSLDRGFSEANKEAILERCGKWPSLVGITSPPALDLSQVPTERIFRADAERTFIAETNRARLQRLLTALTARLGGEYDQGLGFATSFLLLTQDEPTIAAIVHHLSENVIPGYWSGNALGFVRDAYVFEGLVARFHPEVAAHIGRLNIVPIAYAPKWFMGLCVHVLPFEGLFDFFEEFLRGGFNFLMRFGLALVGHLSERLLAAPDHASVLSLLRLSDPSLQEPAIARAILAASALVDLSSVDFPALRAASHATNVVAALERKKAAQAAAAADQEESCGICLGEAPVVFCQDCKEAMCKDCSQEFNEEHEEGHTMVPVGEAGLEQAMAGVHLDD